MDSQKAENLLNLALDTPNDERSQSQILDTGFDEKSGRWELIVRYSGDLKEILREYPQVESYPLFRGYAVLIVPQEDVERLIALPQIIYVEKPKRLYFSIAQGKSASCINPLQYGSENLTGKDVLVAVIDSGIDYYHEDFRNVDGSSRILRLWDQVTGNVYTKEELDLALTMGSRDAALTKVPSIDVSGHGTAVAGIAAGNGRGGRGAVRGIAYESSLLIVKLGSPLKDSFPRTTQLMRAMQFVIEQAEYFKMPLVVNLSFGNSYGSHEPYN